MQRELRDGAQVRQLLDRLVRRPVLAEREAVVREDVDDVQAHQRRQPDRRPHVVGEDQEGRAVADEAAVRRQAVDDRAHRMLAHAEVEVAAGVAPAVASEPSLSCPGASGGLKSPWPFSSVCVDGSRSAEPPTSAGSFGPIAFITLPPATRVAMPFASAGKTGMSASQPSRQFAAQALLKLARRVREGPFVGSDALVPRGFGLCAFAPALRENARAPAPAPETAGSTGQPSFSLVFFTSSTPSGEPCALKLSCSGEP